MTGLIVAGDEVVWVRFIAGSEVDFFTILDCPAGLWFLLNEVEANVQRLMIEFKRLRTFDDTVEVSED